MLVQSSVMKRNPYTLYLGLGAGPLQLNKGMNFPTGEAPDNTIIWSIVLTIKSLSSAKTWYKNI